MKNTIVFLFFCNFLAAQEQGQFTDSRDNKTYKTVKIGNQVWMAENLSYKPSSGNYYAYNNDPSNITKYGYLYDWSTACNVCPNGWKLPSNSDYLELTNYIGQDFKQKMMLTSAWSIDENASNNYGFSGLPAGMRDHTGAFKNLGLGGYFWTSSMSHQNFAFARELGKNAGNWASHQFGTSQYIGMSVRCVKDIKIETSNEAIQRGVTEYVVYKVQNCFEDTRYNTGEYDCDPIKIESYKIKINIHLKEPNNDEALITVTNLKTKKVDDDVIEHIEELEDGSLSFTFSIVNKSGQFILDKTNKTITMYYDFQSTTYYYK